MSEQKTCTRCGGEFGCGRNDADCWCSRLPALPATALDAQQDCYCPRCLAAIVANAGQSCDASIAGEQSSPNSD